MSDSRLRDAERRAKAGDLEGAFEYFRLAGKTADLMLQYDALMTLAEAQNPGLFEQLRKLNASLELFRSAQGNAAEHYERQADEMFISTARNKESLLRMTSLLGIESREEVGP